MCAKDNCNSTPTGKSKYCTPHKAEAREAWVAMIAAKSGDKEARDQKWADLHSKAHEAGMKAGQACIPEAMVVIERAHPLDDNSPIIHREVVIGGVCGFAWVKIGPGNSSFALWLSKKGLAGKAYNGGVNVRAHGFGQSMECKEAYAQAYAAVIREAEPKLKVYAQSRMD